MRPAFLRILWKDSHLTESVGYSTTALGVLGPLPDRF